MIRLSALALAVLFLLVAASTACGQCACGVAAPGAVAAPVPSVAYYAPTYTWSAPMYSPVVVPTYTTYYAPTVVYRPTAVFAAPMIPTSPFVGRAAYTVWTVW